MAAAAEPSHVFAWNVHADVTSLSASLAENVIEAANKAIEQRGHFHIALSGGSLPKILAAGMSDTLKTDSSKWSIWFADERCVPPSSSDSNERAVRDTMFAGKEPVLRDAAIEGIALRERDTVDASALAADYATRLTKACASADGGVPQLDLVLLGMGPDGHTASLFPGHALLHESTVYVAPITDSPKPPSERITLTLPTLKAARACWFVVTGAGKLDAIKSVASSLRAGSDDGTVATTLPSARLRPSEVLDLRWFLDAPAAGDETVSI